MPRHRQPASPFRYLNSPPEVIRLVVMMYVKYPLSLRNVEDLLFGRGIDICHETVRYWWNRFGRYCQSKCTKHDLSASRTESRFAESRNPSILQPCRSTIFDAICG